MHVFDPASRVLDDPAAVDFTSLGMGQRNENVPASIVRVAVIAVLCVGDRRGVKPKAAITLDIHRACDYRPRRFGALFDPAVWRFLFRSRLTSRDGTQGRVG